MHGGRRCLAAQHARGILHFAKLGGMCGDVGLKFLEKEGVNHFGLVMGDTVVETLVVRQQVAGNASRREFYGSHLFAAGARFGRGTGIDFSGNCGRIF